MSIYSGLPTREDQKNYNNLLVRLLKTLQQHVLEVTNHKIDLKFGNKYQKIIGKMETYEEHKYLPPKYSTLLSPLLKAIYGTSQTILLNAPATEKKNFLEAVKEEEEIHTNREINHAPKIATSKNKSVDHLENSKKLKKLENHKAFRSSNQSRGNKKSVSVLSSWTKPKTTPDLKQNDQLDSLISHHQKPKSREYRQKTMGQVDQSHTSEQYFRTNKTIRQKMAILREPKKKIPILNKSVHTFNESDKKKQPSCKQSIKNNPHSLLQQNQKTGS